MEDSGRFDKTNHREFTYFSSNQKTRGYLQALPFLQLGLMSSVSGCVKEIGALIPVTRPLASLNASRVLGSRDRFGVRFKLAAWTQQRKSSLTIQILALKFS